MKKTVSILCIAVLLICAGCSKKPTEKEINNYIGEGMMTNFRLLFSENEYFVNEVFINSHLPVNASETIQKDGKTYAKVVSEKYKSFQALESAVRAVYSAEASEKLLKEKNFYADINGSLYFDLSAEFKKTEDTVWNFEKIKTVSAGEKEYIFSIPCKTGKKSSSSEFKVILYNNDWHLAEVYTK